MPYTTANGGFERASTLGHVPTVQHPLVQEALGRYRMPATRTKDAGAVRERLLDPTTLNQPAPPVTWAFATDSSPFEHEIDPAFPSTRVMFMQLSAVMVNLAQLNTRSGPFVDPAAIKDAQRAAVLAGVLPSSNLTRVDELPPKKAFREEVQRFFAASQIEGRSLLSVLFEVEAEREEQLVPPGFVAIARCPQCDAHLDRAPLGPLPIGDQGAACPACGEPLHATDALRAHESFIEHGSNMEAAGRVMSVAERLILMALVTQLRTRRPSMLAHMAFITDGPLALFGEVAPIKRPLLRRLQTLALAQQADGLGLPVMVGIEKTGMFQEHAEAICEHVPEGMLMTLDDDYLERYITFRGSPHGRDTYYGRHFFYRGAGGQMFTITVPPLGRIGAHAHDPFDLGDYLTLRATCATLDRIATRLYENATIPITLAHQYAAYPLAQAGQVLKLHAEEHLDRSEPANAEAAV